MTTAQLVFDEKERVGAWLQEQTGHKIPFGSFYAMGAEINGQIVGGVVFNNFNESNATAHIAVSKPTKLFLELLDHAAHYAFRLCKLRRLTGFVAESNSKALKLDKRIGFEEEGVLKHAGADGEDVIMLVLWPENYFRGLKDE